MSPRVVLALAASLISAVAAVAAQAEGIAPGLWKIAVQTDEQGTTTAAKESTRCLNPEQAQDVVTTFSPVGRTINSVCAPLERAFNGQKLSWRLVCKGQLDMELTGEFNFDGPKHYTGTTTTRAGMGGQIMIDSRDRLDAQWVSECK